jgi:hypothetical protein
MLALQAVRLEDQAESVGLFGIFPWMEILQVLLPLIGSCKKPVNPAPPNPTPNPSPAQSDAWAKAWHLKSVAVDNWDGSEYSPLTIKRAAAPIRKQKRRDGGPISKTESHSAAIIALDDARTTSMAELYGNVLEATHAV